MTKRLNEMMESQMKMQIYLMRVLIAIQCITIFFQLATLIKGWNR